jgi:lipoprotein-anchoring transpeptidase ErfK/SrfK
MSGSIRALAACLLAAFVCFTGGVQAEQSMPWVLVDTPTLTLSVMRGDEVLATFENISIGSNGTTLAKHVADERTPLGDYTIREIRTSDRFHRFLALDYPSMEDAERALRDGRIDASAFKRIYRARQRGENPPQDTPLGGHLGLHGLGEGSPEIHAQFNWTNGCIALTNEQIDALAGQVKVGTLVRIR